MENRESYSPPFSTEVGTIHPWDTLIIRSVGGLVKAVVMRVYPSGRMKVQHPSGHIIIIRPEDVVNNIGYVPSDNERILRILIKDRQ